MESGSKARYGLISKTNAVFVTHENYPKWSDRVLSVIRIRGALEKTQHMN